MYLKTLTLKGFKSFASSTTLRLEPGITAVVGPNGSGKSNVVDALTWVMGEQGAKNLRGGQMSDVIFAGAGSRPALGRAEVSLTIDNSDGALPIDYTEVTVTRTLFRGGGSEYQINGTPCRLLDVQELLSDTGLGRQMHVIVGQGRLDTVLQASPQERRGFIEEAAGVLKHRRRKERALRKLDSMAGDLARLKDLTAELHRQLGPLARQAAVARRAQVIQATVRDATARLLADDVTQVQALLTAGEEDRARVAALRREAEDAERQARDRLAELARTQADAGQRVDAANRTWEELARAAQSFTTLAQVAAERAAGLAQVPAPPQGTDPDELDRRAEAASQEEEALTAAVLRAQGELDRATAARADAETNEQEATARAERLAGQLSQWREKVARAGGAVASARSRNEASLAALERARLALRDAQARQESASDALRQFEAAQAQPEELPGQGHHDAPVAAQQAAQREHEAASAALTAARQGAAQAAEERREAASERAAWVSRRDTLSLSLRAQDATAQLAERAADGVVGLLAEQLVVARGWENAVAALLGERAGAAVVADDDVARLLLEACVSEGTGLRLVVARDGDGAGESAHCGEQGAGHAPDVDAPGGGQTGGVSGTLPARGLVSTRGAVAGQLDAALDALLEHAWVAEDVDTAWQLRAHDPRAVVATRSGQLISAGWVTSAGETGASVLELAAAFEEAGSRAQEAAEAERHAQERLEAARGQEEAARTDLARALERLREADAQTARVAEESARLSAAAQAATEDVGRARSVLGRAEEEAAQRRAELASATQALGALEAGADTGGQPAGLEEQVDSARQDRQRLSALAVAARGAETEARLALRTAEERQRAHRGRADSLRAAARREREARAAAARAARRRAQALSVAEHVEREAREAAEVVQRWAEQAQAERTRLERERASTAEASAGLREEVDALTRRIGELTDASHRDEVARAEHRMRLESLAERAMSELGLGLEDLVEEFGPHMPVPELADPDAAENVANTEGTEEAGSAGADEGGPGTAARAYVRAEQDRRLARAKRELARLGRVNPLALEEHAALAERHRFLSEQLADLTASRDDLLRIVEQIDARVLEVFTAAWQDTAREFEAVFARLFPGGQGRLELTDPDDMLTTGIEIHARPAGKKVTRLSLLSGGERSLAAVALLIAIFKARPSPFYVMDEVEAALDDTNLGRLLDIFTELRASSQLIVITHQKRTMEVADALYGISMRQGVTQVVSQRLARPHEGADQASQAGGTGQAGGTRDADSTQDSDQASGPGAAV